MIRYLTVLVLAIAALGAACATLPEPPPPANCAEVFKARNAELEKAGWTVLAVQENPDGSGQGGVVYQHPDNDKYVYHELFMKHEDGNPPEGYPYTHVVDCELPPQDGKPLRRLRYWRGKLPITNEPQHASNP